MKYLFTFFFLSYACLAFGQKVPELIKSGHAKYDKKNFAGAKSDYSRAIQRDDSYADLYYYRGLTCMALGEYNMALKDFDKTVELDPRNIKAYYYRAMIYGKDQKYQQALLNLDTAIKIEAFYTDALIMRGQLRILLGNKTGGCEDFNSAKYYNAPEAAALIEQHCKAEMLLQEVLVLAWPKNENWKVGKSNENTLIAELELIHEDETLDDWTEVGFMGTIKGAPKVTMHKAMNMIYEQSKQKSPKAKLTFIDKDENAPYPWIIFTIEAPGFVDDKRPEAQLWYVVKGRTALFTNFRAVRQTKVPVDLRNKWIDFFKTSEIMYK